MLQSIELDGDYRIQPPILAAPSDDGHKHDRGHVAVVSGPELATGAARLSAQAALGMGAGLVTIYGKPEALREHSAHVTAIMLAELDYLFAPSGRNVDACVIGPGHGGEQQTREQVLKVLEQAGPIVLDADALTAFEHEADILFAQCHPATLLTPHVGEFVRLFPDIELGDRVAACRKASEAAGAVVVLKGAETVVAAPDGRFARNTHASPWLATAGSGDVLAGMIGALLGQGIDPFGAACTAVWLHGDIGHRHGAGLTADRMIGELPPVLSARIQSSC